MGQERRGKRYRIYCTDTTVSQNIYNPISEKKKSITFELSFPLRGSFFTKIMRSELSGYEAILTIIEPFARKSSPRNRRASCRYTQKTNGATFFNICDVF